ncbi:hypothetical protein FLAG1_09079 [Fusarium langsethiae]|uniref:Uncharacterized protein n=1 Tax=Fusarium langsethiae TaxID=179993 RepID=A0A0M9ER24_FUSLA|nr:hypothetical protein FLAG1_09079 [Fusarium langsethiae]GKU06146.1 unnamed protein product [Fusarium langsethiae]
MSSLSPSSSSPSNLSSDDDCWPPEVLDPTCGLCRFYFGPGDYMVHYNSEARSPQGISIDRYDVSNLDIDKFGNRFFHKGCVEALAWGPINSGTELEGVYKVAGCASGYLQPPKSTVIHRHRWVRRSIVQDLQLALRGRLPLEIYDHIAGYCTRERATQIIRDARPEHTTLVKNLRGLFFDGESPLWMHHVEIEGSRYVQSLSNSQIFYDDTLLLPAGHKTSESFNIYFAEDYRGIRQIIATKSDEPPSIDREAGLHWVICCRHQKAPFYFQWKNDGVKLRGFDVTKTENNRPDWNRRRWAVFSRHLDSFPQPPKIYDGHLQTLSYYNAVQAVDWNSPGVCGYYFYIPDGHIRGIVTLKAKDPPTAHIDEFDQHGCCGIYVPIDSDERVSELCVRSGKSFFYRGDSADEHALILRTSKGRSHVLGDDTGFAWPDDDRTGLKKFTYTSVATLPEKGQVRMFYSGNRHKGWTCFEVATPLDMWLGLEPVTTLTREITVSLPAPDPYNVSIRYGMSTSAPLEGVKSFRACRPWEPGWGRFEWEKEKEVVGLLLSYTDGSQRSVGQVRPDSLEDTVEVRSDKIWLTGSVGVFTTQEDTNASRDPSSDRVCVDKPIDIDREGYEYLEVPLTGRLVWQFTHYRCAVAHIDSNEAYDDDEIGMALAHGTVNIIRDQGKFTTL